MTKKPELAVTEDGSHTLYSHQYQQYYHNPNGAVGESRHVFFNWSGLSEHLNQDRPTQILEIGFGTGLNFLLLMDHYLQLGASQPVQYYAVEANPISGELVRRFNYTRYLNHPELADHLVTVFNQSTPGFNLFEPIEGIQLHLYCHLFENFPDDCCEADFIFHDAFSPDHNEDLWEGETFKKLLNSSSSDAVLTTYCAASRARGAMCWAGWHVARAPGALGKREMTIASRNENNLTNLERVNETRLTQRYEIGDFD